MLTGAGKMKTGGPKVIFGELREKEIKEKRIPCP